LDALLTLNSAPCTAHPTPYTLHPTPYTLHCTPYTLLLTSRTLNSTPYTLGPQALGTAEKEHAKHDATMAERFNSLVKVGRAEIHGSWFSMLGVSVSGLRA